MLKFRPCYSLRTLLVFTSACCVACWLWTRSRELERRAERFHFARYVPCTLRIYPGAMSATDVSNLLKDREVQETWGEYCELMEQKYHRASNCPWLPVPPDPPEPVKPWHLSSFVSD